MAKSRLHLFTTYYPGSRFEVYMEHEIRYLSNEFDSISIYPNLQHKEVRATPENCDINYFVNLSSNKISKAMLLYLYFDIFLFLLFLEIKEKGLKLVWAKKSFLINYLFLQVSKFHQLKTILKSKKYDTYYSNWSIDTSLTLALLKKFGYINSFTLRTHRYDLYDEEYPEGFIPFRKFQQNQCSLIASISQDGINYLNHHFPELKSKLKLFRLGTPDHGESKWNNDNVIRVVTCSNIKKVKRVELLAVSLSKTTKNIEWHHFGDGDLKEKVEEIIALFPKNIKAKIYGRIPSQELFDFYRNNYISLFINISTSEGIPVSIMEAISFGIPVLATDVGGTSEIINDETGKLINARLNEDVLLQDIFNTIDKFNTVEKRKAIKEYWKNNYNEGNCYPAFVSELTKN